MVRFGDFVKKLRLERRLTLRQFCIKTEIDPSNWSKIERNILRPPTSTEALGRIAKVLDIKKDSEDWRKIVDLTLLSSIPAGLIEEKSIVDKLPILFRTITGESPTKEELEELIRLIKES